MATSSFVVRRRMTPAQLFERARAAEAATGIGRRRVFCDAQTYRVCDNMPNSMMGSAAALVGSLMGRLPQAG